MVIGLSAGTDRVAHVGRVVLVAGLWAGAGAAQAQARVLDAFEDPAPRRVVTSNQVSGALRQVDGAGGRALCLEYDFNGVSGYAGIQRDLPLEFPENYRFAFQLRGDSPANDLQFKLLDASGDNVWWVNRPRFDFPVDWTPVRYRQRHISKAWGPDPDKVLRRSAKLEFTIYNNAGGAGSVCFDALTFEPLPADPATPPSAVSAQATAAPEAAALAIDGDLATALQGTRQAETCARPRVGARIRWSAPALVRDRQAACALRDFAGAGGRRTLEGSAARRPGRGDTDWIALPEAEARRIALDFDGGSYALAEAEVQPLSFSAHPNEFMKAVAADLPRGWLPRGFSGEQPYWTIVGIDGGGEQGLVGEDGAVEVARGGFSIEPFVLEQGRLLSWADVRTGQGLRPGGIPLPNVTWTATDAGDRAPALLDVLAFAQGTPEDSRLVTRYRLTNPHDAPRDYTLALAVRPLQVNPPSQFLNTVGGVSRIASLSITGSVVEVDGRARVFATGRPDAAFATPFEAGLEVQRLAGNDVPAVTRVEDPTGLASGMLLYRWRLAPGETREVALVAPLTGPAHAVNGFDPGGFDLEASVRQAEARWQDLLGQVRLRRRRRRPGVLRHGAHRAGAHAGLADRRAAAAGHALVFAQLDPRWGDDLRRPAAAGPARGGARIPRVVCAPPVRQRQGAVLRRRPRQ